MSVNNMYAIRNIIPNDITVQLPTCMYKLNNIHLSKTQMAEQLSENIADGNIAAQDRSLSELLMIENRQNFLLHQLTELKQHLLAVKSTLKLEQPKKMQCSFPPNVNAVQKMPQLPDILIRVHPKSPPYSLLFVQKLLRNQCQIALTTHLHSSIAAVGEDATIFLTKFGEANGAVNGRCTLNIKLIWKTLQISEMECCIDDSWLLGEVNLLRFVARLIPNTHYEQRNSDEINYILDTVYFYHSKPTEINNCLDILLSFLNKNSGMFLCGNELSIADIAAWSALKQFKNVNINVSLSKWMNKCENIISTELQ